MVNMFLFVFLFMQVVSTSICYDIEIEGAVHLGQDMIRRISNDILPELEWLKPQQKPHFKLMGAEPNPVPRSDQKQDKAEVKINSDLELKNHDKDFELNETTDSRNETMTDKESDMEIASNENPSLKKRKKVDVKFRFHLKHQVTTSGCLRLKMLAYFIKSNLNTNPDIYHVLSNATDDYMNAVNAYYIFISKKTVRYDIDKEFIVLDMIETTNKILLQEAKRLLDAIMKIGNTSKEADTELYMEKIKSMVLVDKKEQLDYVCNVLHICRPFPGYCDRVADLLSDLMQLTDKYFKEILLSLNETVTSKREFFKSIMNDNVYNNLSIKMNATLKNTDFMREIFSIIRSVITQRFKVFRSDSLVLKVKTIAVRILLDLIDKAFEINDDDINFIDMENTRTSYKHWATGGRDDEKMITKKFVYNAVAILDFNWANETKEEVKVLTDVMFTGGTDNVGVYDYLFTRGSQMRRDLS